MELSIPIDFVNTKNVYFVEKKKNIIVEGDFVKVVYSTELFEMNGVYIAIDFRRSPVDTYSSPFGIPKVANLLPISESAVSRLKYSTSSPRLFSEATAFSKIANVDRDCSVDIEFPYSSRSANESEEQEKTWIHIINKNTNFRRENYCVQNETQFQKRTDDADSGKIDNTRNAKKIIAFDSNLKENKLLIEKLCKFERDIIKRYVDENCPSKNATYILRNQLLTNTIKYHSANKEHGSIPNNIERCILKVSGVWETATNVGITMKFILLG